MNLTIITDHKWKEFKYGHELPKKWRKEYDWMDEDEFNNSEFIMHKKWATPISEFMTIKHNSELKDWDAYSSDTMFSGLVIRINESRDMYQIGSYYC